MGNKFATVNVQPDIKQKYGMAGFVALAVGTSTGRIGYVQVVQTTSWQSKNDCWENVELSGDNAGKGINSGVSKSLCMAESKDIVPTKGQVVPLVLADNSPSLPPSSALIPLF